MKKQIFFLDFINYIFETEKELEDYLEHYPDGTVVLVKQDHKRKVANFSGAQVRYIDGSSAPYYCDKDLLIFECRHGDFIIATKKQIERFGVLNPDKN